MILTVTNPKAHRTRRGLAWKGLLRADGKPVALFENAGDGGCLRIDWKPGIDIMAVKAALRATVPGETFEAVDTAIGTLWDNAMLFPGQAVAS